MTDTGKRTKESIWVAFPYFLFKEVWRQQKETKVQIKKGTAKAAPAATSLPSQNLTCDARHLPAEQRAPHDLRDAHQRCSDTETLKPWRGPAEFWTSQNHPHTLESSHFLLK